MLLSSDARIEHKGGSGAGGRLPIPKTYESNFFHHDFVQFTKQHSRYEAILHFVVTAVL